MRLFRNPIFSMLIALLMGMGLGLGYAWLISPVNYVDANPAILRADFKDQYRVVIAAAYDASHDLARARARLELLSDSDPIAELSAQAQRMIGAGASLEETQPLVQLATDLQQGFANPAATNSLGINAPATMAGFASTPFTAVSSTPNIENPTTAESAPTEELLEPASVSTLTFDQTPLAPQQFFTATPRPTSTATAVMRAPFMLVGQDPICNPDLEAGLLQFSMRDSRQDQVAGVEIIVTWAEGEDRLFTGFKPEIGDGYADFTMQADVIYSVRVVEGGSFVPNLSAPACTQENGEAYRGGLLLTFQQP